jgi:chaperonin GroES
VAINTLLEIQAANEFFVPSHDILLIQPVEAPDRTTGGIFLPNATRAPTKIGKVIAAGPGNISPFGQMIPMDHKAGQTVVINPTAFVLEVKIRGVSYLIVRDCECMGTIETRDVPAGETPAQPAAAAPVKTADAEAGEGTTYVAETSNQN